MKFKMKVLEVSQFFDWKGMSWDDLTKTKEEPVLLSRDKTSCLWKETPEVMKVKPTDNPDVGYVWLIKGKNGKPEIYKANYDSSD